MILNTRSGIVLAHLSPGVGPPVDVPSAHSATNVHYCTFVLHINGHVRLYPYLAMCVVLESCEFIS